MKGLRAGHDFGDGIFGLGKESVSQCGASHCIIMGQCLAQVVLDTAVKDDLHGLLRPRARLISSMSTPVRGLRPDPGAAPCFFHTIIVLDEHGRQRSQEAGGQVSTFGFRQRISLVLNLLEVGVGGHALFIARAGGGDNAILRAASSLPPRIRLHAVAGADEVFVAVDVVHAADGGPVFVVAGGFIG